MNSTIVKLLPLLLVFSGLIQSCQFITGKSMEQPSPNVTESDVKRIILRDFGPQQLETVTSILAKCGSSPRVHLAILKLSHGDLKLLKQQTEVAIGDYRDVLAAAEYLHYNQPGRPGIDAETARREAIKADWKEYQTWLHRH